MATNSTGARRLSGVTRALAASLLLAACTSDTSNGAANVDALPTIHPSEGFRLDEGTFAVEPGEEMSYCVRIPVPAEFQGRDLALIGYDSDLAESTHHFFMSYLVDDTIQLDPNGGPVPCNGTQALLPTSEAAAEDLGGGKFVLGAGVGIRLDVDRDPDHGILLPKGGHFITNHHNLNFGTTTANMHGKFNLYVRDAADVKYPTNVLNCLQMDVAVAAGESRTTTATCTVPFDLDVTLLASHAHQHLDLFEARFFDGTETLPDVIYESDVWDSPLLQRLSEPLHMLKGQGITFTCHYRNTTPNDVKFGVTPDGEMCASMNGYALPVGNEYEIPPNLGTLINRDGSSAPLADTTLLPIPFF